MPRTVRPASAKALQAAIQAVPECVAGGYIDMRTKRVLAFQSTVMHPVAVRELVGAATTEMFQGRNVRAIERLFNRSRGVSDNSHHYFQEIVILSDHLLHVLLRCRLNPHRAVVFVCRANATLGMVLTTARMQLAAFEVHSRVGARPRR